MTIQEKVFRQMEECGAVGQRVAVALSGGKDSVCLLFLLNELKEQLQIKLSAVHVHHGIRENADKDEDFVRNLCAEVGIPLSVFHVEAPAFAKEKGLTLEEAARELRYQAFEQVSSDFVALAHHQGDQAETVLLNLLRGSGLKGLGGIRPARGKYIRPMLDVSPEEIVLYLQEHGLSHCEDESNADTEFTRNRIRQELIPYLEKNFNPALIQTLCRTAELLQADEEYLAGAAEQAFASMEGELRCKELTALPETIRRRVIRLYLERTRGLKNIGAAAVERVVKLAAEGKENDLATLPEGLTLIRQSDIIKTYSTVFPTASEEERILSIPGCVRLADGRELRAENCPPPESEKIKAAGLNEAWAVLPAETEGLTIRTRRKGDCIRIFDGHQKLCSKALQDYFVDRKIPAAKRDNVLLLVHDQDILWIVGYRLSDAYRIPERFGIARENSPETVLTKVVHFTLHTPDEGNGGKHD